MLSTKPAKCRHCKERFPEELRGAVIHSGCVDGWYAANVAKLAAKKAKAERAHTKARRAALQTIPELIKAAQREFNAWIRLRDHRMGFSCISSGSKLDWSGNGVDAGHYRSVGAASHLRFNENNCNAQSKHDNQWKAGNVVDYRINLVKRIGLEAVEALEADNTTHKWAKDELIEIRKTYRAKTKALRDAA